MDTRNRFQRIYDARYRNANFTKKEIHEIVTNRISECNTDKFNRLSNLGGNTAFHPRTKEKIIFQVADVVPTKVQPKVGYHRTINKPQQRIKASLTDGVLAVEIENYKARRTANWKSVWYSGNNRRK